MHFFSVLKNSWPLPKTNCIFCFSWEKKLLNLHVHLREAVVCIKYNCGDNFIFHAMCIISMKNQCHQYMSNPATNGDNIQFRFQNVHTKLILGKMLATELWVGTYSLLCVSSPEVYVSVYFCDFLISIRQQVILTDQGTNILTQICNYMKVQLDIFNKKS